MVFTSTVFLFIFLPVVLLIYYLPVFRGHRKFRNYFLLLSSLIFYAWGEPVFIFLMMFSILVTWLFGLGIGNSVIYRRKKLLLSLAIIYHVTVLFIFKYLTFLSQELNHLVGRTITEIDIALPIGISFFTFQMMSYLFDIYYGKATVQRNVLNLGLYVSLFPQLIAGPIVRYETVADEILNRRETREDFVAGIRRFSIGLGKKALLADFLAVIADRIFSLSHLGSIPAVTAWVGAIAYMLQIYFDFSGYSDMAIGLGLCFGFHFLENFNYPYLAQSITDYWSRWHLSMTGWFRDYVYIPMGGSRVRFRRYLFNVITVWVLTGIWHGANWTFLLWGLINCGLVISEKYLYHPEKWSKWTRHMYTLTVICLWLVIFRAASVPDAFRYLSDMFGRSGFLDENSVYYLKNSTVILILGVICCFPLGSVIRQKLISPASEHAAEICLNVLLIFILLMSSSLSISGGYSPFIYFNF